MRDLTRPAQIPRHEISREIATLPRDRIASADSADSAASLPERLAPLRSSVRPETTPRPVTHAQGRTSLVARHISDYPGWQQHPAVAQQPDFFLSWPLTISPLAHQTRSLEYRGFCWATWQRFHLPPYSPKLPPRLRAPLQLP